MRIAKMGVGSDTRVLCWKAVGEFPTRRDETGVPHQIGPLAAVRLDGGTVQSVGGEVGDLVAKHRREPPRGEPLSEGNPPRGWVASAK